MQKKLLIGSIVAVFIVFAAFWAFSQYTTGEGERASVSGITGNVVEDINGERVPINSENSVFEFEGFAVGKTEVGTFDEWDGFFIVEDGEIVGAEGTIDVASVNTGKGGLDSHLKSDDFFDVENFPEIKFTVSEINSPEGQMMGNLLFRGVNKEVSFPVTVGENGVSAEFFLDTTPFNMKYVGVNKEVRIMFDFNN